MNPSRRNDFDDPLDNILAQSQGPVVEPERLRRLEAKWEQIVDQPQPILPDDLNGIATPIAHSTRSRMELATQKPSETALEVRSRRMPTTVEVISFAVAAVGMVVASFMWWPAVEDPRSVIVAIPLKSESDSSLPEAPKIATANRSRAIAPTTNDLYAALSRSQQKRQLRSHPGAYHWLVQQSSKTIGNSSFGLAMLETLLTHNAGAVDNLQESSIYLRRTRRQPVRRDWEQWMWHQYESSAAADRYAYARIALALGDHRSVAKAYQLLKRESTQHAAARCIARHGSVAQIDRSIPNVSDSRLKALLLTRLLAHQDERGAVAFLKYLRRNSTTSLAMELIQSTDVLPTEHWLRLIARRQEQRWDAALAISQTCDRRGTQGLIQLAWDPRTSDVALAALLVSKCDAARQFVSYAQSDQRLMGPLQVAKRKLKKSKSLNPHARPKPNRGRLRLSG